jgi:hypothetical protein
MSVYENNVVVIQENYRSICIQALWQNHKILSALPVSEWEVKSL